MQQHPRITACLAGLMILLLVACSSAGDEPARSAIAVADATAVVPTEVAVPTSTPPSEPMTPTSVRSGYGPESEQFGDLIVPAGADEPAPVVVLIHGGFWRQQFGLNLMTGLADDLARRGYASWNIEYRRVGGAGGWPTTGDDVAAAIDHLGELAATYAIDPNRVVLVGHSAGGHLALWSLGRTNAVIEPVAAIGLGAVVDLAFFREAEGLLGGTIDEVPDVYADAAPVLDPARVVLVQGEADRIVPTSSLAVAEQAGVSIESIAGEDHFDLIDSASGSWAATVDLLAF